MFVHDILPKLKYIYIISYSSDIGKVDIKLGRSLVLFTKYAPSSEFTSLYIIYYIRFIYRNIFFFEEINGKSYLLQL